VIPLNFGEHGLVLKTGMMGNFDDAFSRFDRTPKCDR